MRNLQFVALMLLSAISVGPNLFGSNSRSLASEDCINCEISHIDENKNIETNVKNLSKSLPELVGNSKIFSDLKEKHQCGENDFASSTNSEGRLKEDIQYFVKNDPLYPETDDAQFIFGMNLPSKGRMTSSKEGKPFIGKGFNNDLLMIEKVFEGRDIVGYNVTLSFCSVLKKDKKLIHDDRKLKDLAFGGLNLDEEDTCGIYNDIDSARLTMVSKKKSFFGSDLPFEMIFTAIDCDL